MVLLYTRPLLPYKDEDGKLHVAKVCVLTELDGGRGFAASEEVPAINDADEKSILIPDAHSRYLTYKYLRYSLLSSS